LWLDGQNLDVTQTRCLAGMYDWLMSHTKKLHSLSMALVGSGGAGVVTVGNLILEAAAVDGSYGLMRRSAGPQIRGGESAALLRFDHIPVECTFDYYHLLIAFDWRHAERFIDEIPLTASSYVIYDPAGGDVPPPIALTGARLITVEMQTQATEIECGRANMIALGLVSSITGLKLEIICKTVSRALSTKGENVVAGACACVTRGADIGQSLGIALPIPIARGGTKDRWTITGNQACGLGALKGGVRFVAGYPITPASEMLEWLAPRLASTGGCLIQAEDELASVNMILGASYGGVPAMTATSGPGLALMTEGIGLAVASETPIVVIDVMRGGPSTGIPTKSEQTDLNIALYGMHGEAPHVVVAPVSIPDSVFTIQWAVYLAESLQTAVIVLSDQLLAQSRMVVNRPADVGFIARRVTAGAGDENYRRYALSADGVSAMALPGTIGMSYTADGLEHDEHGTPSTGSRDHLQQLDKRAAKLTDFDYGEHWADIEGDGAIAVVTWGSCTGAVKEAIRRCGDQGVPVRLIALRLLAPLCKQQLNQALEGVRRVLVVEQTFSRQFYHYLRSHVDLPQSTECLARPGPLPLAPGEITAMLLMGEA
jgi:2-oxoglutarate ferredoxin oxidoreductase subunit alpha